MIVVRIILLAVMVVAAQVNSVRGQDQSCPPLNILSQFYASGYMGDFDNIQLFESWKDVPFDTSDVDSFCVRIQYSPGSVGWAGIYWQNLPDNWGKHPGENLTECGYTEITFWARGENGNELVEFKAGDIHDPKLPHRDSFRVTLGRIRLSREWQQYRISLLNKDLSSVIGGFCWVASGNANVRGLAFCIDNVQYK